MLKRKRGISSMPLFCRSFRPPRDRSRISDGRDGDAEVTTAAGHDRRRTDYFLLAVRRTAFFFAGFFFAGFRFAGAFLAVLRVVLANVLLLSMLSHESAHARYSSPSSELTTR